MRKNRCPQCEAHDKAMMRVWRGMVSAFRRDLAKARTEGRTADARRLRAALDHVLAKIRTAKPTVRCDWRKKKTEASVVHFSRRLQDAVRAGLPGTLAASGTDAVSGSYGDILASAAIRRARIRALSGGAL